MKQVTVQYDGSTYCATVSEHEDGHRVEVTCDGNLIGSGRWDATKLALHDLPIDDEQLLDHIESQIRQNWNKTNIRNKTRRPPEQRVVYLSSRIIDRAEHDTPFRYRIELSHTPPDSNYRSHKICLSVDPEPKNISISLDFKIKPHAKILDGKNQAVEISRRGPPAICDIKCTVSPKTDEATIITKLRHNGRIVSAEEFGIHIFPQESEEADLRIKIRSFGKRLHWDIDFPSTKILESCRGIKETDGDIEVTPELTQYYRDVILFLEEKEPTPEDKFRKIRHLGRRLYDIAPPCFKHTYAALKEHRGPLSIQFFCDDPFIPWELMCPEGRTSAPILMEDAVARWPVQGYGFFPARKILTDGIAFFSSDAPGTDHEMIDLCQRYNARAFRSQKSIIRELFRGNREGSFSLIHFAGHGKFDQINPDRSSIRLDDGDLLCIDVESDYTLDCANPERGPIVFFNCCEVGQSARVLAGLGGWPGALLKRRFRGFLAPIYRVLGPDAVLFQSEFLKKIYNQLKPMKIGAALRGIRNKLAREHPGIMGYIYYGNVNDSFGHPGSRRNGA